MIYQLKVGVDANTLLEQPLRIEIDSYIILFNCGRDKLLSEIIIQKHIKEFNDILPNFETLKPHLHELKIPKDPYFDEIIKILQYIDSFLLFSGIKKIRWDIPPNRSFIPENTEEAKMVKIKEIKLNIDYDYSPARLNTNLLMKVIENRKDYENMMIPFAFFREASNEFEAFKYINAYANFYYFLEGTYGNGKWKKDQIIQEFNKSKPFISFLDKALIGLGERHKKNIELFLKDENLNFNRNDIIKLIVQVRGNIHHFFKKSPKKQGHPFNQKDFESMAYLLMRICTYSIVEFLSPYTENNI